MAEFDKRMNGAQVVAASGTAAIALDGAGKVFGKRLAGNSQCSLINEEE